jgi:hypothetical protein
MESFLDVYQGTPEDFFDLLHSAGRAFSRDQRYNDSRLYDYANQKYPGWQSATPSLDFGGGLGGAFGVLGDDLQSFFDWYTGGMMEDVNRLTNPKPVDPKNPPRPPGTGTVKESSSEGGKMLYHSRPGFNIPFEQKYIVPGVVRRGRYNRK